jgi:hypothetical protein
MYKVLLGKEKKSDMITSGNFLINKYRNGYFGNFKFIVTLTKQCHIIVPGQ